MKLASPFLHLACFGQMTGAESTKQKLLILVDGGASMAANRALLNRLNAELAQPAHTGYEKILSTFSDRTGGTGCALVNTTMANYWEFAQNSKWSGDAGSVSHDPFSSLIYHKNAGIIDDKDLVLIVTDQKFHFDGKGTSDPKTLEELCDTKASYPSKSQIEGLMANKNVGVVAVEPTQYKSELKDKIKLFDSQADVSSIISAITSWSDSLSPTKAPVTPDDPATKAPVTPDTPATKAPVTPDTPATKAPVTPDTPATKAPVSPDTAATKAPETAATQAPQVATTKTSAPTTTVAHTGKHSSDNKLLIGSVAGAAAGLAALLGIAVYRIVKGRSAEPEETPDQTPDADVEDGNRGTVVDISEMDAEEAEPFFN